MASLVAQTVKRLPAMRETRVQSLGWEDPLEKKMATHFSILQARERSLVGYSPWGRKEADTTERPHFQFLSFMLGKPACFFISVFPALRPSAICAFASLINTNPSFDRQELPLFWA